MSNGIFNRELLRPYFPVASHWLSSSAAHLMLALLALDDGCSAFISTDIVVELKPPALDQKLDLASVFAGLPLLLEAPLKWKTKELLGRLIGEMFGRPEGLAVRVARTTDSVWCLEEKRYHFRNLGERDLSILRESEPTTKICIAGAMHEGHRVSYETGPINRWPLSATTWTGATVTTESALSNRSGVIGPLRSLVPLTRSTLPAISKSLGIDRAVAYTVLGRGWSTLAGPMTIMMIGRFLRPEEQGFYYTFGSVTALNIFFELGLTYVLLQFASHEKASLHWTDSGELAGSQPAFARLAALLKTALVWYGVSSTLVLLVVLPAGLLFFSHSAPMHTSIPWRTPWIWLAVISALNMFASPLFSVLEGCGKISHIALMRVGQSMIANGGLWLTLFSGGGLLALPVFQSLNVIFGCIWLGLKYRRLFTGLLRADTSQTSFNWRTEVWPFQWRIALSWLSGYFIFQLF